MHFHDTLNGEKTPKTRSGETLSVACHPCQAVIPDADLSSRPCAGISCPAKKTDPATSAG